MYTLFSIDGSTLSQKVCSYMCMYVRMYIKLYAKEKHHGKNCEANQKQHYKQVGT